MKTILALCLTTLIFSRATAQVSVDLGLEQDEFLPNESVRLAVKITNTSGQQLHLGADPSWLTFSVESADGFVVIKNGDVPVVEEFDLESSQMATKHVDLQPYFGMGKPGRYKITATVHIKEWSLTVTSAAKFLDVINGSELWSQEFGVTVPGSVAPEPRRYALLKASHLHGQLRLYIQVSSGNGAQVFRVASLGPLVSFSAPEAQVDRISQLHVLWQTGAQAYSYEILHPDGSPALRDTYDSFNSRPHLGVDANGQVLVQGGVRRLKFTDQPPAKLPSAPKPASQTNAVSKSPKSDVNSTP